MVKLYGRELKRDEALRYVGSIDQLGGVRLLELKEGAEKGVRVALMRTGELNLMIAVDRCLDIASAEYKGIPLGWVSPTGVVAPSFYEPEKFGWLRGFFGGLLTTCGLRHIGAPVTIDGEEHGLHGRIAYSPAKLRSLGGDWDGDEYVMWIEGDVKEARVFEPNLVLRRRIEGRLGDKAIRIMDEVINEGWIRQPILIAYHINIGFPVLDKGSKLVCTSRMYVPVNEEARKDAEKFDEFHMPAKGYIEKSYFHDLAADKDGYAYSAIINRTLLNGIGVYVKFRRDQLNRFTEWKMLGEGTYVVGTEPANALMLKRGRQEELGMIRYLGPQERIRFEVEIGVLVGKEEIDEFVEKVNSITGGARPELVESLDEFIDKIR